MKHNLIFLLLGILITLTSCDYYQVVRGTVVDKNSGLQIVEARVVNVNKTGNETTTDSLGNFEISNISGGFRCPPMKVKIEAANYKTKIIEIPAGEFQQIELEPIETIEILDTSFISTTQKIKSNAIPEKVFTMTNLKHLSIQGMECDYGDTTSCWMIREIPSRISNLKSLETLQLNVNVITKIPKEISLLTNLKSIDLSDNPGLSEIEELTNCLNLEELFLYACNLTKLPKNIRQLRKLRELGLTGNNINKQELDRLQKELPNCKIIYDK